MKKLITLTIVAAFGLPICSFAADKKEKPAAGQGAAAPAAAATKEAAKPAEKAAGETKALPFNTKVDAIDAAAKTFSHTNKDGKVVKFVVTDKTEIKNGEAAAKLEDIKVGDTVSGSRTKKSDTEYEIVKITKFGPAAEKKAKDAAAKPADEKPADKPAEKK